VYLIALIKTIKDDGKKKRTDITKEKREEYYNSK
jgi:hypothetical protein